jgi:hypothetical protein
MLIVFLFWQADCVSSWFWIFIKKLLFSWKIHDHEQPQADQAILPKRANLKKCVHLELTGWWYILHTSQRSKEIIMKCTFWTRFMHVRLYWWRPTPQISVWFEFQSMTRNSLLSDIQMYLVVKMSGKHFSTPHLENMVRNKRLQSFCYDHMLHGNFGRHFSTTPVFQTQPGYSHCELWYPKWGHCQTDLSTCSSQSSWLCSNHCESVWF